MASGWSRALVFLLKKLPTKIRQQYLLRAVREARPADVLLWLKTGADPNLASSSNINIFNVHQPIISGLDMASKSLWKGSSLVILRLLMKYGGNAQLASASGTLTTAGIFSLTGGAPNWLLARIKSNDLAITLDHLLGIWVKKQRATDLQICRLISLRMRISEDPLSRKTAQDILMNSNETIVSHFASLMDTFTTAAGAWVLSGRRNLAASFRACDIQWEEVRKHLPSVSADEILEFQRCHEAARLEYQLEINTAHAHSLRRVTRL